MKPHRRMEPLGRVCVICGWGQGPRRGGLSGFGPALRALGYDWRQARAGDPPAAEGEYTGLGYAHLSCLNRARARANAARRAATG